MDAVSHHIRHIALFGFDAPIRGAMILAIQTLFGQGVNADIISKGSVEKSHNIIIIHSNDAAEGSFAVRQTKDIRQAGIITPIIAIGFSSRNIHSVFNYKAHKYLTYPVDLKELRDKILAIKPFTSQREVEGFYKRFFCDKEYLVNVLIRGIRHDVINSDWNKAIMRIDNLAACLGKEATNDIRQLTGMKKNWKKNQQKWEKELEVLVGVINGL